MEVYDGPKHARLVKRMKRIAKAYGTKLHVRVAFTDLSGAYSPSQKKIWLSRDESSQTLISAFCHELAHFLDHKAGLFRTFYNPYASLSSTRRIALRAEQHADVLGKFLCKRHFPRVKYKKTYWNAIGREFLMDYYRDGRKNLLDGAALRR